MAYQEFYAPVKAFDHASLDAASQRSTNATLREYYAPPPKQIATGYHGMPFDTGIKPEVFDTLYGHTGPVVTIAFSPGGTHVAAGSRVGELRIWSVLKYTSRRDLIGHTDMVSAVAYSADGSLLASGSADRTIRLWNGVNGQNRQVLTGHTSTVTAVNFVQSGGLLFSASEDKTVRVWDLSTGSCRIISNQKPQLTAVSFSRDCELAALSSSGTTTTLKLFNLVDPNYRFLSGLDAVVESITFSQSGKFLAAGLTDNTVQCWECAKDESEILVGHQGPVFTIAFSPDEKFIISGSSDGSVRIWNRENPQNHMILAYESRVWAVTYSPDGKLMAVGLGNGQVRVYDVELQKPASMANKMRGSMKRLFKSG